MYRLLPIDTDKRFNMIPEWEDIKVDIMKLLTYLKYTQNPELGEKLTQVEGDIIEYNVWKDTFWGVYKNSGSNNLGIILMQMRKYLLKRKAK